jgi:endonuclease/exonuclease/phosphatase (EEP) superfamily protein YafD
MVFRIPHQDHSLLIFGDQPHSQLSNEVLKVLVWNVWKGKRGARWKKDFLALSRDRDLILLQEAMADPAMSGLFLEKDSRHEWHMAASFEWRFSHKTGVITGATTKPVERKFLRGSERELYLWTPKISLGTHYEMQGDSRLLVINTHVVNFTTTRSFVRFIQELILMIEHHTGPVILAGDFNTWNLRRWNSLIDILAKMGIHPVDFLADPRLMKLDHVFIRGLKTRHAVIRSDVQSSDHYPLLVDFQVL